MNGCPKVDNLSRLARKRALLYPQHIGRAPPQVLAAIDADQLPGDRARIQKIAQCGLDVALVRAPLQDGRRALAG